MSLVKALITECEMIDEIYTTVGFIDYAVKSVKIPDMENKPSGFVYIENGRVYFCIDETLSDRDKVFAKAYLIGAYQAEEMKENGVHLPFFYGPDKISDFRYETIMDFVASTLAPTLCSIETDNLTGEKYFCRHLNNTLDTHGIFEFSEGHNISQLIVKYAIKGLSDNDFYKMCTANGVGTLGVLNSSIHTVSDGTFESSDIVIDYTERNNAFNNLEYSKSDNLFEKVNEPAIDDDTWAEGAVSTFSAVEETPTNIENDWNDIETEWGKDLAYAEKEAVDDIDEFEPAYSNDNIDISDTLEVVTDIDEFEPAYSNDNIDISDTLEPDCYDTEGDVCTDPEYELDCLKLGIDSEEPDCDRAEISGDSDIVYMPEEVSGMLSDTEMDEILVESGVLNTDNNACAAFKRVLKLSGADGVYITIRNKKLTPYYNLNITPIEGKNFVSDSIADRVEELVRVMTGLDELVKQTQSAVSTMDKLVSDLLHDIELSEGDISDLTDKLVSVVRERRILKDNLKLCWHVQSLTTKKEYTKIINSARETMTMVRNSKKAQLNTEREKGKY